MGGHGHTILGMPPEESRVATGEPSNMGILPLKDEAREKKTFGGNKWIFLNTLDQKGWQDFLSEFKWMNLKRNCGTL